MQASSQTTTQLKQLSVQLCTQLSPAQLDDKYRRLIQLFKANPSSFVAVLTDLSSFLQKKFVNPDPLFFNCFNQLLHIIYTSENRPAPQFKKLVFELLPQLLIKFQQSLTASTGQQNKELSGIDQAVLTIYNNQREELMAYQKQLSNNSDLPTFMKEFLPQNTASSSIQNGLVPLPSQNMLPDQSTNLTSKGQYSIETQVKYSNKWRIKSLLLAIYESHIGQVNDKSLQSFLKLVYVYCGGQHSESFSLYLLNRPDDFSIFYHRISEEELEWILMCLNYICVNKKYLKYEVINAISLVRKKCGNQCKFRVHELSQSLLHLFQNQYQDIF